MLYMYRSIVVYVSLNCCTCFAQLFHMFRSIVSYVSLAPRLNSNQLESVPLRLLHAGLAQLWLGDNPGLHLERPALLGDDQHRKQATALGDNDVVENRTVGPVDVSVQGVGVNGLTGVEGVGEAGAGGEAARRQIIASRRPVIAVLLPGLIRNFEHGAHWPAPGCVKCTD